MKKNYQLLTWISFFGILISTYFLNLTAYSVEPPTNIDDILVVVTFGLPYTIMSTLFIILFGWLFIETTPHHQNKKFALVVFTLYFILGIIYLILIPHNENVNLLGDIKQEVFINIALKGSIFAYRASVMILFGTIGLYNIFKKSNIN